MEGGAEEEVPAGQFQAHAEYTPEWMSFLAELFQRQAAKR
jgi:hypothetical protein